MAMTIGGEGSFHRIGRVEWTTFAQQNGLDETALLDRVYALVAIVPDAAAKALDEVSKFGSSRITSAFVSGMAEHVSAMSANLE